MPVPRESSRKGPEWENGPKIPPYKAGSCNWGEVRFVRISMVSAHKDEEYETDRFGNFL